MLEIRINGQSADLRPGTSLTYERFNPLFDIETVQGGRVYGFFLPNTPRNRRILGQPIHPQCRPTAEQFQAEKYLFGQLMESGVVGIQDASREGWNLYFSQNLGEIFGDLQKLPLSEWPLASGPIPTPVAEVNPATSLVAWPTVENPAFYGNEGRGGYNGRVNDWSGGALSPLARVPMPFLRTVFDLLLAQTGWTVQGRFCLDAAYQRLLVYNTYSLDERPDFMLANHLPALSAPQYIMELRKLFNLYIEFDLSRKKLTLDLADQVISQAGVEDWTSRASREHTRLPELARRLDVGYEIDANDALLKPIPAEMNGYVTPGEGTLRPVKSRISTLLTNPVSGLPQTSQSGQSLYNRDGRAAAPPKLLFFQGLSDGQPRASSVYGGRSLLYTGAGSLAAQWQTFERLLSGTFLIRKNVLLSPLDLARFSFRRAVHIRGVNYIVGKLSASIGQRQQAIPCQADLYRL